MNPRAQNNKCVIYARLSRLTNEHQGGLERQEADCLDYARRHGFEVIAVLKEAQSAYSEKERPQLRAAMQLLASGEAQHLICWKYDRLSRGGISGLAKILDDLQDANASLHLVTEGIDATTSAGRIILSVLSEIARSEAENASLRYKRMHQERAAQGKKHNRSFGFTKTGEHVPEEVERLREAAQWVQDGKTLRQLAIKWNEENVSSATGKTGTWVSKTISRMLQAPSLRGVRLSNGIELPGDWEPIFEPEEHARIMAAIRTNPKARHAQSLLGGLGILVCEECNHVLRAAASPSKNRAERYACPSPPEACGKVSVARFGADEKVVATFVETIDRWQHPLSLPAVDILQAQLDQDEESLKQLTTARFVDRAISDDAYLPAHDQLQERITEARAQIKARANQPTVKSDLPEPGNAQGWWDAASLEEQRRALRMVVKKVLVKRTGPTGPRLNPDRITVELNTDFLWSTVSRWSKEQPQI